MSDAVGGRGIRCQIGRTSLRSCFTGQGVAQSFFVGNTKKRASSPGCCGWCGDTFQPELVACSRAAQLLDESLGTLHGGWVQSDQILFHQAPAAILWRGGDILPSRLEEVPLLLRGHTLERRGKPTEMSIKNLVHIVAGTALHAMSSLHGPIIQDRGQAALDTGTLSGIDPFLCLCWLGLCKRCHDQSRSFGVEPTHCRD